MNLAAHNNCQCSHECSLGRYVAFVYMNLHCISYIYNRYLLDQHITLSFQKQISPAALMQSSSGNEKQQVEQLDHAN